MPRPTNTALRRAQIAEGLLEVMAERGYEGASIAAVAKAAGLATGLVHYHFQSKREILLASVTALAARRLERVRRRVRRSRSARARLRAFVDAHLALGADADPGERACWVWISAEAVRDPAVGEALEAGLSEALSLLTELLRSALGEAGQPQQSAPRLAAAVLAAVHGYCTLATVCPGLIPPGSAAPTVWKLLDGLL